MKRKNLFFDKSAFTLTEILVVVAIIVVVIGLVHTSFLSGNMSGRVYETRITVQREARKALSNLVRELREASDVEVTSGAGTTEINFSRTGFGAITYSWSDSGVNENQLLRNNEVVASYISTLSFDDNTDSVTINLTSTKTIPPDQEVNIVLKEKVALR